MLRESNGRYWHDDTEISAEEYEALLAEISAKNKWVNDVFFERTGIDECPAAWRDEISRRVQARGEPEAQPQEIDDSAALEILLGGAV